MHVMLKRAAASAIPVLLGLAVSPATAMAAPQSGHLHLIGGSADGVIAFGNGGLLIGNHLYVTAGPGIDNSSGATVGNGVAGTAGNSLGGRVFAAVPPQ